MRTEIPYGKGHLAFEHENINRIVESRIGEMKSGGAEAQHRMVLDAMAAPEGGQHLSRLAEGKKLQL